MSRQSAGKSLPILLNSNNISLEQFNKELNKNTRKNGSVLGKRKRNIKVSFKSNKKRESEPPKIGLMDLPFEILLMCFSIDSLKDIHTLFLICKSMNNLQHPDKIKQIISKIPQQVTFSTRTTNMDNFVILCEETVSNNGPIREGEEKELKNKLTDTYNNQIKSSVDLFLSTFSAIMDGFFESTSNVPTFEYFVSSTSLPNFIRHGISEATTIFITGEIRTIEIIKSHWDRGIFQFAEKKKICFRNKTMFKKETIHIQPEKTVLLSKSDCLSISIDPQRYYNCQINHTIYYNFD